ncbi:glycoside hydrolase family 3 C-terminal domain-containing protein [Microbispora bryophytorum]|uniref:Exo-alpha-(1->6)-L-arabinopyranosidase n=1 Tax=Microbispora bryophytorum TaxID=1460882 RepID=A0A8H9LH33_9ACTN|nr:glycoside hydrolase family 3 C-terminal domain-containing protein [Microbispora bryophytorum]MBD3137118.1 glycoside hydrolase family 3 C-terminal domain-containing protein [Microbispora bryophytorum]TQS07362.1 beta-glucosidase [Microbispora bryophytorum]GGO14547.1 glycosyl hydrolase [Microbispora bryophytorum]
MARTDLDALALNALTLEQKASLLSGRDFWTTKPLDEAAIPSITLCDGPHGVRREAGGSDHLGINESIPATCFPPAAAVGSSWDPEVAARIGAAVGREGRALGVAVVLGPGVNIKRSPLCGRNFEYYSEDPLLSGVLAAAHVAALQAEGPGASVKHFAANNQETERMRVSAEVDERTLREIYFPAFERVVTQARPATVMCSYNRVNGVHASQNRWLLTDVLRREWGFNGVVVSDWGAVQDRVAALAAGLDLEMPRTGGASDRRIVDAVRAGDLDEATVNASVRRVVALTERHSGVSGAFDSDAHHALARELAAECAVLLKNEDGTLPLSAEARIAVIGEFAARPRFQGGGSSHVHATRVDAALDAIRALAPDVAYAPGFSLDGSGDARELREAAAEAAASADVAVVFAGLSEREESEGFDRETIDLPAVQIELIRAVAAATRRTVVVLSNGGVVSLEGWHDDVDAVLEGWLLGQAGGSAVADLLFGAVNPSGRLAESIPVRLKDTPSYLNFPGEAGQVRYGEGVMVGYRYYETVELPVRYPFGHGLSYTTFAIDGLRVVRTGDDRATVTMRVTNTGDRAGKHVVQVYVSTAAGPVRRPVRELRAFRKVSLAPGESRTVTLPLDRRAFAYYDVPLGRWTVAPGDYTIQIGENASSVVAETTIGLGGDSVVPVVSLDSTLGEWLSHPLAGPALLRVLSGGKSRRTEEDDENGLRMASSMPMGRFLTFAGIDIPHATLRELVELGGSDGAAA